MDGEEEGWDSAGGDDEAEHQEMLDSLKADRHVLDQLLVWNDNESANLTFNWNEPDSDEEESGTHGESGSDSRDGGPCVERRDFSDGGLDDTSSEAQAQGESAIRTTGRTSAHADGSEGVNAEEDSVSCAIEFGGDFVRISDGNAVSATITKDMFAQWESFLQSKHVEQQRRESDCEGPSS